MVACENVTQDISQNLTLSGLIERLIAPAFPTITPSFYVAFGLQNILPGIYVPKVVIEHIDGTRLVEQVLPDVAVPSQQKKARLVIGLRNFTWPKPGEYVVRLSFRDEIVGAFTLELIQGGPAPFIVQSPPGTS